VADGLREFLNDCSDAHTPETLCSRVQPWYQHRHHSNWTWASTSRHWLARASATLGLRSFLSTERRWENPRGSRTANWASLTQSEEAE